MGRPPVKPKGLRDGFYIEVRTKGAKNGIKIRRETKEQMERAIEEYSESKEVIVLGEYKKGKSVNEK